MHNDTTRLIVEERACEKCKDTYPLEDMPWGLCPDCWDNLEKKDLEDRIEELL